MPRKAQSKVNESKTNESDTGPDSGQLDKKSETDEVIGKAESDNDDSVDEHDDSYLPQKNSFRIDEAARYFNVGERTIRMWIDHGHLRAEKVAGSTIRITRRSMLNCRFANTAEGRAESRMI